MKIAKDKKLHLIYGAMLSSLGFIHTPLFLLGFIVGILKEIYDMYVPNHTSDIMDAFYTWIGASIPLTIYLILKLFNS